MQSLFPYQPQPLFRQPGNGPATWDRYYPADPTAFAHKEPETASVSSGLAAGITIAIFFLVFIFTFGCRIYSEYVDRGGHGSSSSRSNDFVSRTSDYGIDGFRLLDLRRTEQAPASLRDRHPNAGHAVRPSASLHRYCRGEQLRASGLRDLHAPSLFLQLCPPEPRKPPS
ncbi:hypothetical protein PRIPAC_70692 [Pristionchus pacificus]|uniref:Uncharacterized protein n=1 Tax=Pristionchus pacificus TaxID=54126 RepID=A0A2A6C0L5_PRIPA|nr:hypothetical protein PRIPAC_70692 [Pristionchus pacificus]|eukprot:PDM71553.1 hypothetical protein PRIPAC_37960 [Pristionchus pacificus]